MKKIIKGQAIYILLTNIDKGFLCDYVEQTGKILSQKNIVIVAYYTKPYSIGFLYQNRNRRKLLEILSNWKKIIFSPSKGIYECEFISLIPFQRVKMVYELNKRLTRFELKILLLFKKLLRRRKFNLILWVFHPSAEFFVKKLGEKISLYDCIDYLEFKSRQDKQELPKLEDKLLKMVDYVFANSAALASTKNHLRKDVKVVPCGCAIEDFPGNFHAFEKPKSLRAIDKPIVGFVGHLDYRLDFELVKYLLVHNPDLAFVFMGKVLEKITYEDKVVPKSVLLSIKELQKHSNFYLLPQVSKKELIHYLHFFSVALIPYNLNYKFVYYANPMKFYEYLTIGLSVVSVPIPAISSYRLPNIRFADKKEAFNMHLQWLIAHPNIKNSYRQKMRKIALNNSWERKVTSIEKEIFIGY